MLNVGWFSTGRGEGSLGLLRFVQDQILGGELDARIQFVFSNREPGEAEGSDGFFRQVKRYDLPLYHLSSQKFRKRLGGSFADHRLEYDREVMELLNPFTPDVVVLAGYMLIVGREMCHRYNMLNLHPALPTGPIGTWQEVIWTLIESRAQVTGAMVHLVTEDVDRGPVVSYFTVPIVGGAFDSCWQEIEGQSSSELKAAYGDDMQLFRLIRQEEYRREPHLIVATLDALARGAVEVRGGRILDATGSSVEGHCVDREIEAAIGFS